MIDKLGFIKERYPFRQIISDLLNVWDLENIHLLSGDWLDQFYNVRNDKRIISCYDQFLKIVVHPFFNEKIMVQRFPNLKIQIPGEKSVTNYHTDNEYGHDPNEFNIWLPLTDAAGTRSIYIESSEGRGDHSPQDVRYGQFLIFPGSKLSHGNEINTTSESRFSLDFRVIQERLYRLNDLKTIDGGQEVSYFKTL